MDLLSKRIVEQVREKAQARSAEQIAKGVMSKDTKQAISESTATMNRMREAMQDVVAKTISERTPDNIPSRISEPVIEGAPEKPEMGSREPYELEVDTIGNEALDSSGRTEMSKDEADYETGKKLREEALKNKGIMSPTDGDADGVQPTDGKDFEFEPTSKRLVEDLKKDFDLTTMQASAIVGNLATETDNFNTLQEYKPLVEGSRGGYGFAQWTGPRRKRYEAWAKENNLDPSTYEANYGYLKYELSNTDPEIGNMGKNTIKRLKKATNLNEATSIVMKGYLKPGVPHLDKRQKSAAAILGFFD